MPIALPARFDAFRQRGPEWARWLDALPRVAGGVLREWGLAEDGDPLHGHTALVLPVRDADGVRLMLKLVFVEPDNVGEPDALKVWRGLGAVRLERADPRRGVLLLERLGERDLSSLPDEEAIGVLGRLYRRLHVPAVPQLPPLAGFVRGWLDDLAALGKDVPAPPRFVQQALTAGWTLVGEASESARHQAVVHGDLHYANVLAGRREPWLAIDPKGFNGDPCFEPAPLLWNRWDALVATGDVGGALRERFYGIVDAAGLDERRCRDWVILRTMINCGWLAQDAARAGRPLTASERDEATRNATIAKAMQDVLG